MGFDQDDLTRDRFLGGLLQIWQPRFGYRAGVDSVLLAAAVAATPGDHVLDLGCGAGVASLCLARRVPELALTGVEVQDEYAKLAKRNAAENNIEMNVVTADVSNLPPALREQSFDHVISNPPYYRRDHGTPAADAGRDKALAGDTLLAIWIDAATRRLKPGGYLTIIQRADRMSDLLRPFDDRLGSIRIKPLAPRAGRAAELVLVVAQKGGRGALRLLAPLILHRGDRHDLDGESYTPVVRGILRNGDPLEIG